MADAFRVPTDYLVGELPKGGRSIGGQYKRYKDVVKKTQKQCELGPAQLETAASGATHARPVSPTDRRSWIGPPRSVEPGVMQLL